MALFKIVIEFDFTQINKNMEKVLEGMGLKPVTLWLADLPLSEQGH